MFSKTLIAAFAATLIASTQAHLAIQEPPPIPGSDSKSPLDPSGSNFPCQGASLSAGTVTQLKVGQNQPLNFNLGGGANTAVHGGGSCQVSITYETDAAALKDPSNWKVIHSYLGGCPTEAMGNLDNSVACAGGDTACVDQSFGFDVPSEVKDGSAILAWTWFNNIGNREMYMNCAKVSISGGSDQVDSLPSLFAANIGNGCSTTEQFNTDFPNPGKYVTKSALNYPLKAPVGSCGSGPGSANTPSTSTPSTGSSGGSTGGSTGGKTPTSASSGSATTAAGSRASKAPKTPKASGGARNPGVFAEGQATTLATAVAAAPTAAAAAPAPAAPAPVNGSIGACATSQVACSQSGFYCISESQFGMCAWGCATPMAVAAGTTCSGDAIVAAKTKRHLHIRHKRGLMALSH